MTDVAYMLVHGGSHGAWCWDFLAEDLTQRGYRVFSCLDDRPVPIGWARRASLERLGVTPIELQGGHSPFLSRPQRLADALEQCVGASPTTARS